MVTVTQKTLWIYGVILLLLLGTATAPRAANWAANYWYGQDGEIRELANPHQPPYPDTYRGWATKMVDAVRSTLREWTE